jgi:DNA replication protein DnaC
MSREVAALPRLYTDRSFDTYQPRTDSQRQALASMRDLARGAIRHAALLGKPGVGKTHLAAAAATEWARHHQMRAEWVNVPQLLVDLRSEYGTDDFETRALVRTLRKTRGLVVLDDLGREKASDWTSEMVYTLINARYEDLLPTCATTNLTPDELVANGYWPAFSRLAEDGALIRVDAPDERIRRKVA